jgi:hypothetical protein
MGIFPKLFATISMGIFPVMFVASMLIGIFPKLLAAISMGILPSELPRDPSWITLSDSVAENALVSEKITSRMHEESAEVLRILRMYKFVKLNACCGESVLLSVALRSLYITNVAIAVLLLFFT